MTPVAMCIRQVAMTGLWAMFSALPCNAAESEPAHELAICADPSNLPFSNQRREGFENRIADLIAADLHATVRYTWNVGRRSFLRRTLFAGECDVVMGVPAGLPRVSTTRPYYASTYVFVSARSRHLDLHSFDDPALPRLTIGLHAIGADGANTPPATALARRGIVDHIVGYPMWGEEAEESPPARIVDAVAAGDIDTAIVWGPFAGYFARGHGDRLTLTPVDPDPRLPALRFTYAMAVAVRPGEEAFKARLQDAMDRHREDIARILKDYGVPLATNVEDGQGASGMPAHAGE
jgi:quinoprotein dehydrogenase-associated probable ABC transporter substrate-binding protein